MKSRLCILPALLASVVIPAYAQTTAASSTENALPEIKIMGAAEPAYSVKRSASATKTDTLLRDTPQAVTVITKDLIRDQAMQSIADAIRYVPGIVTAQGEGNRDTAVFRGNSSTGDFYVDGIRDDVQYYRDFYNIDSVEALKGSNAMIFGRGGSGGVINRVTKQAEWRNIREASLSLGSWNNRRLTVDVGQALNDTAALRVNGMIENSDSYRQGYNLKRSGINPTLSLRAGANTSVVLGYEHFKDERTTDRGIPSFQGKPIATDASTFFGNPEVSQTWSKVDAFSALIEHDFGNGWTIRNRSRYASYDKFYQNVFSGAVNAAGTMVALQAYNNATQRDNFFNQTDLMTTLDLGATRHKLVAGAEVGRQETDNYRNTGYFLSVGPAATSILVPVSNPQSTAAVTFKQSATDANNHGVVTIKSVYLQDQIEFSPQWQAIVGVRRDSFAVDFTNNRTLANIQVTDTPVSPRAGLVFKPITAVSLYASYSLAYAPRAGDQLASLTASNKAFDPEKFKNLELGAKWDVLPDLAASVALYQLDRSNVAITDPLDVTKTILVDGQRSKGLELGLSGNITPAWSIMGGYAYQDAKITQTQSASVKAGATLAQVPRHSASLWNRYNFTPAWGVGVGVVYRSEIFPSTDNTVVLPGFTRVDAALYYMVNKNLNLQVNVENVFDKSYYASANSNNNITPGAPIGLRVGLNAKF
ncbi:MAG: TonB-dependent siderophore receptor [Undibacterium sp.]|uniref:TonB-dependent receptor n=1 Tax=Undibacterium sp. TaxID=1914977 RepID=UPI00271E1CAA|nr:TonB-dependent siderophore receptor [Undibacterium sp.]MDO8651889.1 TonB-dependent siderophore receptor [Undibacterium sp.]